MIDSSLAVDNTSSNDDIRSRPSPNCYLCGALGESLYEGLTDRLFGAPGRWGLKRCPNQNCGLTWLDPMPLEEDIGKAYRNYFTHVTEAPDSPRSSGIYRRAVKLVKSAYLASRFDYGGTSYRRYRWLIALPVYLSPVHRPDLDFPLIYLTRRKAGRLLEVGCGCGDWLRIAENLGWRAEGVDFDPAAVANARSAGLTVHTGQLADQNFGDRTFDLVFLSHVIEHVHDPIQLLRECHRVLKHGGLLVVWTPNSESWGHSRFTTNWSGLHPPQHLWLLKRRVLGRLGERAAFKQIKTFTTIRTTAAYFVTGKLFERYGQVRTPGTSLRIYGYAAALAERVMMLWRPYAGEELIAELRK